jgi:type IV pilus assembly protein PilC
MPNYIFKGKNSYGEKRKGKIEAVNEAAGRAQLKRMRITPTVFKEAPKDIFADIPMFQPKVTGKDVVIFTRQLSTMIDAGLPLVQSLEILAKQQDNPTFKKVLMEVKADVETGSTIADSIKKHPKQFDDLYCNMIDAGEIGGILDTILSRLASYMEKSMALIRKVKGAMTYPVICLCICGVVMAVMLIFVVPVFQKMFEGMGGALPGPTQFVVDCSEFLKSYFILVLIGMFCMFAAMKKYRNTDRGRKQTDKLLLIMPIMGPLLRRVAVAKFSRTLCTMVQSGVPILDALNVVARTAGNKVI